MFVLCITLSIISMVLMAYLLAVLTGFGSSPNSDLALWHLIATIVLICSVFKLGESESDSNRNNKEK